MFIRSALIVVVVLFWQLAMVGRAGAGYSGFVEPTAWTRGVTANSTYQEWDVFTSTTIDPPLNAPDVGSYSLPALPAIHDVSDASGASFLTGGGNIYSFSTPLDVDIVLPNFASVGGWTTITLQTVTQGEVMDLDSLRIVLDSVAYTPVDNALLYTVPLGGFGGVQEDRWFEFHLPGNAALYTIEFSAAGSSLSLDKIAVDTAWTSNSTPMDEPSPLVPPQEGDVDLDGDVDFQDFLLLQVGYGNTSGAARSDGDLDADGDVDFQDFLVLQVNFGAGGDADFIGDASSAATLVPEPGTLFMAITAALALAISAGAWRRRSSGRTEFDPYR